MKFRLPFSLVFSFAWPILISACKEVPDGYLKAKDKAIVNGTGEPFILRGIGLG